MDFEAGVPAADLAKVEAAGLDAREVARLLSQVWGEMSFASGWVHCDPHPGNLAVDHGYPGGRLIYYDFGMMEVIAT